MKNIKSYLIVVMLSGGFLNIGQVNASSSGDRSTSEDESTVLPEDGSSIASERPEETPKESEKTPSETEAPPEEPPVKSSDKKKKDKAPPRKTSKKPSKPSKVSDTTEASSEDETASRKRSKKPSKPSKVSDTTEASSEDETAFRKRSKKPSKPSKPSKVPDTSETSSEYEASSEEPPVKSSGKKKEDEARPRKGSKKPPKKSKENALQKDLKAISKLFAEQQINGQDVLTAKFCSAIGQNNIALVPLKGSGNSVIQKIVNALNLKNPPVVILDVQRAGRFGLKPFFFNKGRYYDQWGLSAQPNDTLEGGTFKDDNVQKFSKNLLSGRLQRLWEQMKAFVIFNLSGDYLMALSCPNENREIRGITPQAWHTSIRGHVENVGEAVIGGAKVASQLIEMYSSK
jgi:hypothetical protein